MKILDESGCGIGGSEIGETEEKSLALCPKKSDQARVLRPANLDLSTLVVASPLAAAGWESSKALSKLAVAVHLVMEGPYFDSHHQPEAFWVPIHSSKLDRFLGPKYAARAMRVLADLGVIEINSRYSSGKFPKSYRLT